MKVQTVSDLFKKKSNTILAYKSCFESEDGKIVMQDLMKSCFMLQSTMDANPHEMAFNEGARSVVLRILTTLKVDPVTLKSMFDGQSQE